MPQSAPTDVRDAVIDAVAKHCGVSRDRVGDETRIVEDLHQDGDDVVELVDELAKTFDIDVSGYRWYHHHGPEGCNPLWLIYRPWWMKKTHIPLRVADLVEAARSRVWPIKYPTEGDQA